MRTVERPINQRGRILLTSVIVTLFLAGAIALLLLASPTVGAAGGCGGG